MDRYLLPCIFALAAAPVLAQGNQQRTIPLGQAADIATQQVQGTVEEVDLEHEDGRLVWEVEIEKSDGHDVEVLVDAFSGEVIKIDD